MKFIVMEAMEGEIFLKKAFEMEALSRDDVGRYVQNHYPKGTWGNYMIHTEEEYQAMIAYADRLNYLGWKEFKIAHGM